MSAELLASEKAELLGLAHWVMDKKKGGDSVQFSEYVQKNLKLYSLRTGSALSTHGGLSRT